MTRREPLLSQEPWPKVCDFGMCKTRVACFVIMLHADEHELIKQARVGLCAEHAPIQVALMVEDLVKEGSTRGVTVVLP